MTKKNIELTLYVSAVMLAIGVFLPLTTLPVYGEVSYNRVAAVESYLVILFALSAPVLLFIKKINFVKLSPVGVWLVLLFPAIKGLFQSKDDSFLGQLGDKASSAMQEFAGDLFLNIADFSWGGFIFIIGLLAFTVSCVLRSIK